MAWLAVDEDGQEVLFSSCPRRNTEEGAWIAVDDGVVEIRKGAIQRLIGKELTWLDEPIEF